MFATPIAPILPQRQSPPATVGSETPSPNPDKEHFYGQFHVFRRKTRGQRRKRTEIHRTHLRRRQEKVSHNARKHGLSGAKFFCPEHLRPLLAEIEQEYRQSIRPIGFLEEDALIQLRNARFNMERAQILMEELGREADSRGVDPLADPATRKDYLLYQRYFNQNRSAMQGALRELRKLQSERVLREQHNAHERFPGLADLGPSMRLYHQHMRDKQRIEQLKAQQALHAMMEGPLPGEPGYRADLDPANQTNPRHTRAA